jgi:hypothetical protein
MARRSLQRVIYWLLPLLAVRALIPVGFMLTLDAEGLHLVACPTQSAPLAAALDSAAVAHDTHAHHAADKPSNAHAAHEEATQLESPCPYALAALALPAPAHSVGAPHEAVDPPPESGSLLFASNGPARTDRIRGPPQFS